MRYAGHAGRGSQRTPFRARHRAKRQLPQSSAQGGAATIDPTRLTVHVRRGGVVMPQAMGDA